MSSAKEESDREEREDQGPGVKRVPKGNPERAASFAEHQGTAPEI